MGIDNIKNYKYTFFHPLPQRTFVANLKYIFTKVIREIFISITCHVPKRNDCNMLPDFWLAA